MKWLTIAVLAIAIAAAIAASGLLPGFLRTAGAAASTAPRAFVDWHSHFVSQAEVRYFASRSQPPRLIPMSLR